MLLFFISIFLIHSGQGVDAFTSALVTRPVGVKSAPARNGLHVSINSNSKDVAVDDNPTTSSHQRHKKNIRPLTQNWWPVSLLSALDKSKPNPIELLNQKLVLWHDAAAGEEGRWTCLDDRCAHRFAPLSEGRVVNYSSTGKSCLQCAYHGWEFDGEGGCAKIPQAADTNARTDKLCSVQSYPIEICGNMIWVWADPGIGPIGEPEISNLLERFDKTGGTARGFQRDLPYGFEYLGENQADVSHLPFSHHSVGTLNREDGRPVPLEMLSEDAKLDTAILQKNQDKNLPPFQVRVVNAAEHDPEIVAALKYNPAVIGKADPKLANCTIGFYDPCHIRYHRNQGIHGASYEIDLFMCPTTEGKSRVFLFVPSEQFLPKEVEQTGSKDDGEATKQSTDTKSYRPHSFMQGTANKLFGRFKQAAFPPHVGHFVVHSIFDGDGIFLNKQGDRMRRAKLTFKNYNTPTSADLLVNAFRRWLDKAAEVTTADGNEDAANAATGGDGSVYEVSRPRSELLDRYASHTANCNICRTALEGMKNKRDQLSMISTALIGAVGASGVIAACTTVLMLLAKVLLRQSASRGNVLKAAATVLFSSVVGAVFSWVGVKKIAGQNVVLERDIKKFYFEDYVHAEKD